MVLGSVHIRLDIYGLTFIGVCGPERCFFVILELSHPGQIDIEMLDYQSEVSWILANSRKMLLTLYTRSQEKPHLPHASSHCNVCNLRRRQPTTDDYDVRFLVSPDLILDCLAGDRLDLHGMASPHLLLAG